MTIGFEVEEFYGFENLIKTTTPTSTGTTTTTTFVAVGDPFLGPMILTTTYSPFWLGQLLRPISWFKSLSNHLLLFQKGIFVSPLRHQSRILSSNQRRALWLSMLLFFPHRNTWIMAFTKCVCVSIVFVDGCVRKVHRYRWIMWDGTQQQQQQQ